MHSRGILLYFLLLLHPTQSSLAPSPRPWVNGNNKNHPQVSMSRTLRGPTSAILLRPLACRLPLHRTPLRHPLRLRGGVGEGEAPSPPPAENEELLDLMGDGGVLKDILVCGYLSPMLSVGDEVSVSVIGRSVSSGQVFLNRTGSDPLVWRYGRGEVVRGLEIGVGTMKQGEEARLIVRGRDYGYGAEPGWKEIPPNGDVEFTVDLVGWGEKDLTGGKGGVLFRALGHVHDWDAPGEDDEVLLEISCVRARDGCVVVPEGGEAVWVNLGQGSVPRGVALGVCEMRVGMTAKVTVSGEWVWSKKQLGRAGEEMAGMEDKKLDADEFFRPNHTAWGDGEDVQWGVRHMTQGDVFVYTLKLVNFHSVIYPMADRDVVVKLLDHGTQEYYMSDVADGDEVEGSFEAWIPVDGFRQGSDTVVPRQTFNVTVGDGQVPKAVDVALKWMHRNQKSRVLTQTSRYSKCLASAANPVFSLPEGVGVEVEVELKRTTRAKTRGDSALATSVLRRKEQGNQLFMAGDVFEALEAYQRAVRLVPLVKGTPDIEGQKEWVALQLGLHLNVAACRLKQGKWESARKACEAAFRLDPKCPKTLLRRAQAHVGEGAYEEAQRDLRGAIELDPEGSVGRAANAQLKVVDAAVRARDKQDKGLYARMMGSKP